MEEIPDLERKIAEIEAELSTLDHRRGQLLDELANGLSVSFMNYPVDMISLRGDVNYAEE